LRKKDISQQDIEAIAEYNKLDIELYSYAKEIFERQIRGLSRFFRIELLIFKLLNKFYQWVFSKIIFLRTFDKLKKILKPKPKERLKKEGAQ